MIILEGTEMKVLKGKVRALKGTRNGGKENREMKCQRENLKWIKGSHDDYTGRNGNEGNKGKNKN